jgi:ABC-type dipeptide/oligopeptide/nickel transport system permease component
VKGDHLHHQENRPVGGIVLAIVSVLVLALMRALPDDPIHVLATRDQLTKMTPERIEELRHEAGLDRNVAVQYFSWVGGFFKGDVGRSILYKTLVSDEILRRLPITFRIDIQVQAHQGMSIRSIDAQDSFNLGDIAVS